LFKLSVQPATVELPASRLEGPPRQRHHCRGAVIPKGELGDGFSVIRIRRLPDERVNATSRDAAAWRRFLPSHRGVFDPVRGSGASFEVERRDGEPLGAPLLREFVWIGNGLENGRRRGGKRAPHLKAQVTRGAGGSVCVSMRACGEDASA
jgi:hypothetical protein